MPKLEYQDLMGKPFRLGGRGPTHFDCWGICLELGKRIGLAFPEDFTPDSHEGQDKSIREKKDKDFIRLDKPEPFAIVTFKVTPPFVDHCGMVLSDCIHFVHIMRGSSVSRNRLDNRVLAKRIEGFYKLRENGIN